MLNSNILNTSQQPSHTHTHRTHNIVDMDIPEMKTVVSDGKPPQAKREVLHIRQDSASELEKLFNSVLTPSMSIYDVSRRFSLKVCLIDHIFVKNLKLSPSHISLFIIHKQQVQDHDIHSYCCCCPIFFYILIGTFIFIFTWLRV